MDTSVTIYKADSRREFAVCLRELNLGGGVGREMGGRFKREGI